MFLISFFIHPILNFSIFLLKQFQTDLIFNLGLHLILPNFIKFFLINIMIRFDDNFCYFFVDFGFLFIFRAIITMISFNESIIMIFDLAVCGIGYVMDFCDKSLWYIKSNCISFAIAVIITFLSAKLTFVGVG